MTLICPRCGERGSIYYHKIANRHYIYFVHKLNDGDRKQRKCYIGPANGYIAAAKLHNISIPHAFSIEHKLEILEELLQYFTETCKHIPSDDDEKSKKAKKVCEEAKEAAEEFIRNLSSSP